MRADAVKRKTAKEGWGEDGKRGGVSTGADTKANTRELVRAPGGLLERLQRGVAFEALGERGYSFGIELVK